MDLPIVEYSQQKRPTLKAETVSNLIAESTGQEQAIYVLKGATGLRVSELLALEIRHIINEGRTIKVEQQVAKNRPLIVRYLKTSASYREVDLHPDVAEYLRRYTAGKTGLLFPTEQGTPRLYGNLQSRWLKPRLDRDGDKRRLALIQAIQEDMAARSALSRRLKQLLDGAQAADHERSLLAPV